MIHVEPGSWSGADNGDPEFKKWNADPNAEGYSPDRNSWAVMTAASNLVKTATQVEPENTDVLQAVEYLHVGQSSDYWYWDWAQGGIWDTHPTRAANLATELVSPLISGNTDGFGPSIFLPQRESYNPGGVEWTQSQSSDFQIWTLVYDYSGLASVELKVRQDADGINDRMTSINEVYQDNPGVGLWESYTMAGTTLISQTNILPDYISQHFSAELMDYSNVLLDYYVEAIDSAGNLSRSPIQHVYVGESGGSSSGNYNMDGQLDEIEALVSGNDLTLHVDFNGSELYVATQSASSLGQDVFILIADSMGVLQEAPWAKSGQVAAWDVFLANESTNNWCGWFDQDASAEATSGSILEGTIRVADQWPELPDSLFFTLATYSTNDGGGLLQQLPAGNENATIEPNENVGFKLNYLISNTESPETPLRFFVGQAYPNPFNPKCQLSVNLAESSRLQVDIYDIKGRHVQELVNRDYSAGVHILSWNAENYPSGIYLARISNGPEYQVRRLILNR